MIMTKMKIILEGRRSGKNQCAARQLGPELIKKHQSRHHKPQVINLLLIHAARLRECSLSLRQGCSGPACSLRRLVACSSHQESRSTLRVEFSYRRGCHPSFLMVCSFPSCCRSRQGCSSLQYRYSPDRSYI